MCCAAVLCLNGISPSLHLLTYVTLFTLLPSYKLCSLNMAMSVHIDVSSYVYYIIMFPLPWPWHCTVYSLPGIHRRSFHQRLIFIKHYLSKHWKNLGVVTGFDLRARRHKMESQNPAILAKNNNKTTKNKKVYFSVLSTTHKTTICGQDWTSFYPVKIRCTLGISLPLPCVRAHTCVYIRAKLVFSHFYSILFLASPIYQLVYTLEPLVQRLDMSTTPSCPRFQAGFIAHWVILPASLPSQLHSTFPTWPQCTPNPKLYKILQQSNGFYFSHPHINTE